MRAPIFQKTSDKNVSFEKVEAEQHMKQSLKESDSNQNEWPKVSIDLHLIF